MRYAPVFSAEDREAALGWINENMSPQQETFENVRALVPFFELLYQSTRKCLAGQEGTGKIDRDDPLPFLE